MQLYVIANPYDIGDPPYVFADSDIAARFAAARWPDDDNVVVDEQTLIDREPGEKMIAEEREWE